MVFWFAGLSFLLVAWVFASPAIDYRLVIGASLLPVVELVIGGPWPLHTLAAPVLVMVLVMVIFRGQRLAQRRWLGISIGLFMHLVLDGSWARTTLFWWPLFGTSVDGGDVPTWPAPAALVVMELVGLIALVWAARRYRLDQPAERARFLRDGQLSRAAMTQSSGTC